ncbi:MAG: (Fe-S)-binding protein, partial [Candidatus Thorarchaeota archaeon]
LSKELAKWVYECSECGNCSEVCHMSQNEHVILPTCQWIDHVKVWDALRKDLVEAGFAPIGRHNQLVEYLTNDIMKNPYNENNTKKFEWLKEFPEVKEQGDFVFFGGCTIPLRQNTTLKSMMRILNAAGKTIALSKDEWCCGSIVLRIGDEKPIYDFISHNVETFKNLGAKTIFTACAGCYRTWKKDYPELLGEELPFEVKHITEILVELLRNNQIPFKSFEGEPIKVTYHDPCHLGRHMGMYDIPRQLISKIPGIELVEMKRIKQNAWCCGAGGGVKSEFPELALNIAKERIKEAIETEASILTTSCPFCIGNLTDAYNSLDINDKQKIKIIDILDLIAQRI